VLSSSTRAPARNNNNPSPASTPASHTSHHAGGQHQHSQHHTNQSITSPKVRSLTPSSVSHLATSTASTAGGGGGGGGAGTGGPGVSRGVQTPFPLYHQGCKWPVSSSGWSSDRPNIATTSSAGAHSGQSSLSKISVAQVFLLLDSINEKEGKEKWETKAAQIHKVSRSYCT
jgi:CCR4-NOT transcription complex subunit 1